MSKIPTPLQLAVEAARNSLAPVTFVDGNLQLRLSGDKQELINDLQANDLLVSGPDNSGNIEIVKPAAFFEDIDSLLIKAQRRIDPPKIFYLHDLKWISAEEDEEPEVVSNYKKASRLISLLKSVADHCDKHSNDIKLIFLQQDKLVVGSSFTSSDLVNLDGIEDFESEFINSETHREKKAQILKSVFFEKYKGKKRIEISQILKDFSSIHENLTNGYDLFVSEFSYEKIKSQAERDKLEFTTRLNKVFSDIQNQLLAVPAALLLVGSQMEKFESAEWHLSNISIWLGALIFTVLMELLIRNQRNTLQAVKNEMNLQEEIFKEHHLAVFHKFKDVYVQLNDRFKHQCFLLWFVRGLVGLVFGFTTSMLIWYSTGALISLAVLGGASAGILPVLLALIIGDYKKLKKVEDK